MTSRDPQKTATASRRNANFQKKIAETLRKVEVDLFFKIRVGTKFVKNYKIYKIHKF